MISILGAALGTISSLFIYPLDMSLHGLCVFILSTSLTFAPFLLFGSGAVAINNYQEFKTDDKSDNGFLSIIFSLYIFGSALFALVFYYGADWMAQFFNSNNKDFNSYFGYILPLTVLQAGCFLIDVYLNNFMKVIIPAIFKEFLLKLTLPLLIGLHILGYISIQSVILGLLGNYILALILLLLYTFYLRRHSFIIRFKFLNRERIKRIGNYAFFAILGAFGSQLVNYLDVLMIKAILPPLEFISIYNMNFNLANFINMPIIAIIAVAGPLVARHIADKDKDKLAHIYASSSTIMLLVGCFLMTIILINLEDIYGIMKNGEAYATGSLVFIFLGVAKLFDMATGLNSQIIGYSKYFKINFYSVLLLGIFNAVLNYSLIHRMGISGAALATLISMTVFNIFKLWFVRKKFGIWPFTFKGLYILGTATILGLLTYVLPLGDNHYVMILARSALFTIIFWAIALRFDFSPQITLYFKNTVKKYLKSI